MAKNIDIKEIQEKALAYALSLKNILRFIAANAFVAILLFVFVDILIGASLFYKYVATKEQEKPVINTADFQFKENVYNKILEQWSAKDKALEEFIEKNYKTLF